MTLRELIHQSEFASPAHESLLNVIATASWMSSEISAALAPHGITQAQYNVLRILRGRHPERHACAEIGERLLDRTPDVTRLLVRLEGAGLVTRRRADHDRRVVEVGITDEGLALLAEIDAPLTETMERLGGHLTDRDHARLSDLLETLRTDQT